VFSPDPAVGFLSHALKFSASLDAGKVLAPANSLDTMRRVIVNDYVDATLAGLFVAVVIATVIYGFIDARKALGTPQDTTSEVDVPGAALGGSNA
jgi:carbon starvation protein